MHDKGYCIYLLFIFLDSIKAIIKSKFSSVSSHFGDMESFSELVIELENAIGNYSSTVRNIKSGEQYSVCACVRACVRVCVCV